jgi:peroxiredoxin Q/BCP
MKTTNQEINIGDLAPDFEAQDESGKKHALKDYKGKTLILYFYPKDNTSGCTQEACDFRDSFSRFSKKGATVLGVSPDSAKSHQGFKSKYDLPFPLLADEDKKICEAYGVWKEKSMYGRKYMGLERSTFLIGPDGRIQEVFRKVKVSGHVEELSEKV